ncbi:hypothetical protein [uncultured Hymenobacter sp.]|uniref:hypothetical protein n=1 Tax=uncultured Hymenobacter sp. TaxID=170016 RepID=UPI0035CBC32F
MPLDYFKYPKRWRKEVRPRILARDGNRCRCCRVENHAGGYRDSAGRFHELAEGAAPPAGFRFLRILLNVVHLDHSLVDHSDANLGLMCQQCHVRYDKPVTAAQAAATTKYPGAAQVLDLFHPEPLPAP